MIVFLAASIPKTFSISIILFVEHYFQSIPEVSKICESPVPSTNKLYLLSRSHKTALVVVSIPDTWICGSLPFNSCILK